MRCRRRHPSTVEPSALEVARREPPYSAPMRYPVLSVIVVATLVGCGGSDSEDGNSRRPAPSTEAQPTRDEFVRRVDALCEDTNPELAKIMSALTKTRDAARGGRLSLPRTFEAFATLLRRADAATERFRARLRAIEVPKRERAFYDALIDSVEAGSSNLRRQVSAAEARDAARLRDLSVKGSVINARAKGLIAGHGGFRFCGRR